MLARLFKGCIAAIVAIGALSAVACVLAMVIAVFTGSPAWFFGALFAGGLLGFISFVAALGLAELDSEFKKRLES